MMRSVTVKTNSPKQRQRLEEMLGKWQKLVMEALDRGEKVTIHSHQECKCFGSEDLFEEFIFLGWSFGVTVGDYPKEAKQYANHKRIKKPPKKEVEELEPELVGSSGVHCE